MYDYVDVFCVDVISVANSSAIFLSQMVGAGSFTSGRRRCLLVVSFVDGVREVRCYLYVDGFGSVGGFAKRSAIADLLMHHATHELQLRGWQFE